MGSNNPGNRKLIKSRRKLIFSCDYLLMYYIYPQFIKAFKLVLYGRFATYFNRYNLAWLYII
jgi:hypothetical protein